MQCYFLAWLVKLEKMLIEVMFSYAAFIFLPPHTYETKKLGLILSAGYETASPLELCGSYVPLFGSHQGVTETRPLAIHCHLV